MKMKKLLFAPLALLILSCGNNSNNNSQIVISVRAQVSPPLQPGVSSNGTSNVLTLSVPGGKVWSGNLESQSISELHSDDYLTYPGNLSVGVTLGNYYDLICRTVSIDTYVDGNVFDSRLVELGTQSQGLSPSYCQNGIQVSYNLIIP